MKIELDSAMPGKNRINAYSSAGLIIGTTLYSSSIIITPDGRITAWPPQRFTDLASQHFHPIVDCAPEVVLVGTGRHLRFPANSILLPLLAAPIGFEIMDTGAACRAYNFLMGEGRRVAAALLMIEE